MKVQLSSLYVTGTPLEIKQKDIYIYVPLSVTEVHNQIQTKRFDRFPPDINDTTKHLSSLFMVVKAIVNCVLFYFTEKSYRRLCVHWLTVVLRHTEFL